MGGLVEETVRKKGRVVFWEPWKLGSRGTKIAIGKTQNPPADVDGEGREDDLRL